MKFQFVCSVVFALLATVTLVSAVPVARPPAAAAQGPTAAAQGPSVGQPRVVAALAHDTSPPLRSMSPPRSAAPSSVATSVAAEQQRTRPLGRRPGLEAAAAAPAAAASADPVAQAQPRAAAAPAPSRGFDGLTAADDRAVIGLSFAPSDANGDAGPGHYIQTVNTLFAVYDKNGTRLFPPSAPGARLSSLFAGFGGLCETHDDGDPIVLYDALADRWLLSQFALGTSAPFLQCIAISATVDPLGAYHRYAFAFDKVPDYPKLGVWPDAYYMSANQFDATFSNFLGAAAVAFDRTRMLAGQSATMIYVDLCLTNGCADFALLPSDLDGTTPPPAGTPNTFVELRSTAFGDPADALKLFDFHVDFMTPANSSFTVAGTLPTVPFSPIVCGSGCIPQQGSSEMLDALSDRLMYRLAYRNLGTHQALVVNHTVNAGGNRAGIRWYELRKVAAAPYVIFQQGTYAGDGANALHRWMGSIAMDRDGNIALGYSASGSTAFPSIRYTGRLATDPPGTLPQGETTLVAGTGSQINSQSRWGDYSAMAVDPSDDCTFWYTNQYYATTSSFNWRTRIGAFNFPSCPTNLPLLPTPTSTPASTITPTPTTTSTPTVTPTSTSTPTPTPTSTGTPAATPTPTPGPCILGDINCDGIVDVRDYAIWRQNFGATNCGNRADLNLDCIVDIRDYGIWRQNFGHTAGAAAPAAVPPPPLP